MTDLNANIEPASPRKRRWIRFSLKTLLILMTVLAVWLGLYVKSLRDRKAAVLDIKRLNGVFGVRFSEPEWLRHLVGDEEYFYDPVGVHFNSGDRPTDDDLAAVMKHLQRFRQLRHLTLAGTGITDASLSHLCALKNKLEMLDLSETKISDAGLPHLRCLTALKTLRLQNTATSLQGMATLQQALPNCTIDF
jgi:hypothetical protein